MQPRNPGHVTINNRRVKVQKWRQTSDRIEVAMLVHGHQSGLDLLEQMSEESITLQWDGVDAIPVRPELSKHHVTGDGAATVHRIEATLWPPAAEAPSESIEARLLHIEVALKQVQAELYELKHQRGMPTSTPRSLRQRLDAGQTLIDTDIEIDE